MKDLAGARSSDSILVVQAFDHRLITLRRLIGTSKKAAVS